MDILFIDPPYSALKGMTTERGYNVGLTSLAAYLRNDGIETAVIMGDLLMGLSSNRYASLLDISMKKYAAGQRDYERIIEDKNHVVWQKIADIVRQTGPMAVGIPYLTPLRYVVERIAGLIKEIDQDIIIIAGSFHPTFCPEEVMQNPDIDFVVKGEGEIPLLRLVKEIKKDRPKWETVPGIYYRDREGLVKNNPCTDIIHNLDELPFPARDLVLNCDHDIYRVHFVSTARGCPYTCTFCADRQLWGGRLRRRSVENVIEELKSIQNTYNLNYIDFVDGTFTYDRKYLRKFCRTMIEQKLNIEWRCTARYDNLNEELLELMKEAKCSGLYLGFESGSERILKTIDKKTSVEQNIRVSKMIYKSGIPSVTGIMLGLPDESEEDMEKTMKSMKRIKTDIYDINNYIPLPGTQLYDDMGEEDKKNINWRKVGLKSFHNYFLKSVSYDDFQRYLSKAYGIANSVRIKTIFRFGVRMLLHSIVGRLKKLWARPVTEQTVSDVVLDKGLERRVGVQRRH